MRPDPRPLHHHRQLEHARAAGGVPGDQCVTLLRTFKSFDNVNRPLKRSSSTTPRPTAARPWCGSGSRGCG